MRNSSNSFSPEKSPTLVTHDRRKRGDWFRWVSAPIAWLRSVISKLVRSKSATIGVAIILFWIFVAIASPIISPYSPTDISGSRLKAPSGEHWLGTDSLGRDVLSRLIWGTREVFLLAPISVFLGLMIGAPLGLSSGYLGGYIDLLIMRGCDISCLSQCC
jgi:peptide/nickel transport system permease protein